MSQDGPPLNWPGLKCWIAQQYPNVRHIDPAELAALLLQQVEPLSAGVMTSNGPDLKAAGATPLLIDIRSPAEQEISSLAGARCVHSVDEGLALVRRIHTDNIPIVVFCSAGIRSARLCDALMAVGYNPVFNLDGGLFAWATMGLPLVRGSASVQLVHPFDERWATLLPQALRAAVSSARQ